MVDKDIAERQPWLERQVLCWTILVVGNYWVRRLGAQFQRGMDKNWVYVLKATEPIIKGIHFRFLSLGLVGRSRIIWVWWWIIQWIVLIFAWKQIHCINHWRQPRIWWTLENGWNGRMISLIFPYLWVFRSTAWKTWMVAFMDSLRALTEYRTTLRAHLKLPVTLWAISPIQCRAVSSCSLLRPHLHFR